MTSSIFVFFLFFFAFILSLSSVVAINETTTTRTNDFDVHASVRQRRRHRGRRWVRCRKWKIFQGWNPSPRCIGSGKLAFWQKHQFKYIPQLSDDFFMYGGVPNPKKWIIHDPHKGRGIWAGRQPGLFIRENIWTNRWRPWNFGGLRIQANGHVRNSRDYNRVFKKSGPANPRRKTFEQLGYQEYSMGMLSSKKAVKYGYFEVESKTMKTQLVNSWWFSNKQLGIWSEIDVYENSHVSKKESKHNIDMRPVVVPNALFARNPGVEIHPDELVSAKPTWYTHRDFIANDRHTYGLLWTKKEITYFFDGKPYATIPNRHWHQEMFVRFDVETNIKWHGIAPNVKGLRRRRKRYSVHYFRVWNVAPINKPFNPVARVSIRDDMKDELAIQGSPRLATTSVVRNALTKAMKDKERETMGADADTAYVSWNNKSYKNETDMFCLQRSPREDEVFGEMVEPDGDLTMTEYIRKYEAEV